MGYGGYDTTVNCFVNSAADYKDKSNAEIFRSRSVTNAMNPNGVEVRESRDSADHPNSLAVILGLDVTASMGSVPSFLIKEGFNAIMEKVIKNGELDPQILFMGIGDHECDSSPFQVGQFESNDELLHKWFTEVYLEGGGGGNAGESYLLAWYFAAYRTSADCFEKRGRKGLLFTIGDEPVLEKLPAESLVRIFGEGQYSNFTAAKLVKAAQKNYEVYHIHVTETSTGQRTSTARWKELLGQNLLVVERSADVASVIAETISKHKQEGVTTTGDKDETE